MQFGPDARLVLKAASRAVLREAQSSMRALTGPWSRSGINALHDRARLACATAAVACQPATSKKAQQRVHGDN